MSTKSTILHGDRFHCYHECMDDDNIYIEIENPDQVEVRTWGGKTYATLAIPARVWNLIVRKGELESWSGENFENPRTQEQRQKDWTEAFEANLEALKRRREENDTE